MDHKLELLLKFCSFVYFIILSYKGQRLSLLVQNVFVSPLEI